MRNIQLILICLCFTAASCSNINESTQTPTAESNSEIVLTHSKGDYTRTIYKDTILAYDLGKYLEYSYPTDYVAGIISSQLHPLRDKFVYGYASLYAPCNITKGLPEDVPFDVAVNKVVLTDGIDTRSESRRADISSMFGSNVTYNLGDSQHTKSDYTSDITLYAPEVIEIQYPKISSEDQLYPLCLFNSFGLEWNADEKNENGVMVVIEWHGAMVFGEDYPNAYIRSTDVFPDTGKTCINPQMFDGIPDTALCTLTILRGSIENELVNGYSCKLVAESHQCIQFILIRNVKKNEA